VTPRGVKPVIIGLFQIGDARKVVFVMAMAGERRPVGSAVQSYPFSTRERCPFKDTHALAH
jgi:hypothetical protein